MNGYTNGTLSSCVVFENRNGPTCSQFHGENSKAPKKSIRPPPPFGESVGFIAVLTLKDSLLPDGAGRFGTTRF